MPAHLHFAPEEYAARQRAVVATLQDRGLDALLCFLQESMYYLTGYDTAGYSQFQCMILTASGEVTLVTRSADLRQSAWTSLIEDVRIWTDRGDANPGHDVRDALASHGLQGRRLGVELEAWCLTARRWEMLKSALGDFAILEDASDLVLGHRLVKSEAELAYVRRAGELADIALQAGYDTLRPGVYEGDIYAAMLDAGFRNGGDYPASRHIIGSGEGALMVRNYAGRGTVGDDDQLMMEFGAAYRHYHACLVRVALTGTPAPAHRAMHEACVAALAACQEACRPGREVGDVFDAHARVLDEAGFAHARLNACGYSISANYPPTWMEQPMFFHANRFRMRENMVFFMHMFLLDERTGLAMATGESCIVHADGVEKLSGMPHELVVK